MPPRFTMQDVAHVSVSDAEMLGNLLARDACGGKPADFTDVFFGKFRVSRAFAPGSAFWARMATIVFACGRTLFTLAIRNVVRLRAAEQMGWSNAGRSVTPVQDEQSRGNGTKRQFPCDAVSTPTFPLDPHLSVSGGKFTARPEPAFSGFIDVFPKAVLVFGRKLRKGSRSLERSHTTFEVRVPSLFLSGLGTRSFNLQRRALSS